MKVESLEQKVEKLQRSKRDATLQSYLPSVDYQPAPLRGPPATRVRRTLKGHFGKVTAVHWGGDSRTLVSASQDGNLLIWNAVTANKVQAITLKSSYVMSVGIEQKHCNLVACGGLDNLCTVYSRSQPNHSIEMASHDGFLSCCRFLSEQEIITSSADSTCIHWDIAHAKPISTFAEHTADAMFISLKPGDKNVFVSCSVDKTAKVWDLRSPSHSVQSHGGHLADVCGVDFMPSDGHCFATCSLDGTVRVFDIRAYNELTRFGNPVVPNATVVTEGFTSLAVSKSGRIAFCGHSDGSVLAYDVLSDKGPAFVLQGAHDRNVSCIGVAPQGNALATGSWDTNIKIWA
jgi:guanine nucleotide-binding protein G(I)/G(S)/G(T) subunit beta-1